MEPVVSPELLDRFNRPGPRYTSYPTVPAWSEGYTEGDYRRALAAVAALPDDALSVYVHLPFCADRCAYCGCTATVTNRAEVVDRYLDRVERELALVAPQLGGRRRVVQLHWGGGTPNFLNAAQASRLFGLLDEAFAIERDGEVSLEIDPRIGTPAQLALYRQLGFNRVSFGVQDIDPRVQQAIGRVQPFAQTSALYHASRELGFSSVNLDIVYGLPYQTAAGFAETLRAIVALRPDRLACFSYAHVPWVKPNQKRVDTTGLPTTYEKFRLFQGAIAQLGEAGYTWVGMDHFALDEDELAVAAHERRLHRNFMGYTTKPAPHMLAFGMSAIGDLAGNFVQNDAGLGRYQRSIDAGQLPIVRGHVLSDDDRMRRMVILHLMCNLELPYSLTREAFGRDVDKLLPEELERLAAFADEGFIELLPDRIQVTRLGRYFLRNLGMELDAYLKQPIDRPLFSKTV